MSATSPQARYDALLEAGRLDPDPGQAVAMAALDELYARLTAAPAPVGWLGRLTGRWRSQPAQPETGLYLWGGVGRGKTLMMDLFFEALPFPDKLRMHFHRFMREAHDGLTRHAGQANPLRAVADGFADRGRVLCFDEFFVSDIGDAMILAELLEGLFARGVTLVATSNVVPERLYENGLQRRRFLPAIAALERHTRVLNVDGGIDHRLRVLEQAEIYHVPLDDAANASLEHSFLSLAGEEDIDRSHELNVLGRGIRSVACAEGVVWFEFAELCDGPRSANDYIELARLFHTVVVAGVPQFTAATEDQARRFIALVDEFYDRNVKLILSAAAEVTVLYAGERLRFEFERTASRLLEMRSYEYLARPHKA